MSASHVLYRFYGATGQLLYVGITMNPAQRFKSHKGSKDWWGDVSGITIENYSSREDLAKAERRAIQVEHPLHNIVHTKPVKFRTEPAQRPAPPPPAAPQPDAYLADLFKAAGDPLTSLNGIFPRSRETCYGTVTDEEFERKQAAARAKQQERRDCHLCDESGYRPNMRVCNHIDYGDGNPPSEAQRRVQKESLQVIQGGA